MHAVQYFGPGGAPGVRTHLCANIGGYCSHSPTILRIHLVLSHMFMSYDLCLLLLCTSVG